MITKEQAKQLAPQVLENIQAYQNFPGSCNVVYINADQGTVGTMNKDHRTNGWQGIFFGGCSTLPQIYGRINQFFNPEIL